MHLRLRHRIRATIPGIAWRDARLAERAAQVTELRTEVAQLRARVARLERADEELARARRELTAYRGDLGEDVIPASFRRHLMSARRTTPAVRRLDRAAQHPFRQIPFKLRNYRLAASHGVPVPSVLAVWRSADDIALDALPESFVVKSDRGAGSHGVLPLRRTGPDRYRLVGSDRELSAQGVRDHLDSKPSARGPFFAEELLEQEDLGPGVLPDDVKVYAFYGRIGHVLLRRPAEHGDLSTMAYRYVDGDGADLGEDISPGQRIDVSIPLPGNFEHVIEISRHLSRAVPLPFLRVDVYDTVDGPVFGELTRTPGGRQLFRADHDRSLGELWDRARIRVDVDIQAGRPPVTLHGSVPTPNPYPADHVSHEPDPRGWTVHQAPCAAWCGPPP